MIIVLLIAVALVAFCFGVGGYAFFTACKRAPKIHWDSRESVENSEFSEHFDKAAKGNHWLRDHNAQDLYMTSKDGLKLHAYWIPAHNARATVVFLHGYHGSGVMDFSIAFDLYHDQGFNILMPDQRAHNESEGRFITFGVRESADFLQWILLHNQRFGEFPILCSGLSMGAATLMFMAGMDLPENVRGLIADCGFTSPKEILAHVLKKTTHLPAWPFMWATEIFARLVGGFSLSEKHTTKTLAHNQRPILFVHGLDDTLVPPEMTKRSFEACAGEKHLLLVEGAEHALSFLVARDAYVEKRNEIAEKVLGGRL